MVGLSEIIQQHEAEERLKAQMKAFEDLLVNGTAIIQVKEPSKMLKEKITGESKSDKEECKHKNVDPQPSYLCEDCGKHLSVSEFNGEFS